jgi:hypothetical protein
MFVFMATMFALPVERLLFSASRTGTLKTLGLTSYLTNCVERLLELFEEHLAEGHAPPEVAILQGNRATKGAAQPPVA